MNEGIDKEVKSWEHHDCVDDSLLSQRAKIAGERITKKISNDVLSVSALRLICPRWKENVVDTMSHSDTTQLERARGEVQGTRNKLEEVKLAMLNIVERKEKVLDFFKYAISQSEGRFQGDDECQTQRFFANAVEKVLLTKPKH